MDQIRGKTPASAAFASSHPPRESKQKSTVGAKRHAQPTEFNAARETHRAEVICFAERAGAGGVEVSGSWSCRRHGDYSGIGSGGDKEGLEGFKPRRVSLWAGGMWAGLVCWVGLGIFLLGC